MQISSKIKYKLFITCRKFAPLPQNKSALKQKKASRRHSKRRKQRGEHDDLTGKLIVVIHVFRHDIAADSRRRSEYNKQCAV